MGHDRKSIEKVREDLVDWGSGWGGTLRIKQLKTRDGERMSRQGEKKWETVKRFTSEGEEKNTPKSKAFGTRQRWVRLSY